MCKVCKGCSVREVGKCHVKCEQFKGYIIEKQNKRSMSK